MMITETLEHDEVRRAKSFLSQHKRTWLPPTLISAGLTLAYVVLMTRYWEASQTVVVRQDAAASTSRPGKFADLYEMRTLQETILELARSKQVVGATLQAVDQMGDRQPSAGQIEEFRDRFRMSPPGGAEFGKTEVFYLSVKDPNRDRAVNLVSEACRQLNLRLQDLREDQAGGLIVELEEQLQAAEELHAAQTNRLAEYEAIIGADLGELRMLHSALSGQSDLRQQYVALEADSRRYKEQVRETSQLLQLLKASQQDAGQLAALPNSLLTAQPALRRLKDGLVDAQLQTARLQGTRSAEHPRVRAAQESEASIRRDLAREMHAAIRAAEAEMALGQNRYSASQAQLERVEKRLADLAQKRAEYSNRVSALEASRESVDIVRQQLAAAKATQAAARSASVLTLVDEPETGPSATGASRAMTLLAGLLGGFALGLGLVFYRLHDTASDEHVAAASLTGALPAGGKDVKQQQEEQSEWWETSGPDLNEAAPEIQPTESPRDDGPSRVEVPVPVTPAESRPVHEEIVPTPTRPFPEPPSNDSSQAPTSDSTVMLPTPVDSAVPGGVETPFDGKSVQDAMRDAFTPSN